MHLWITAAAATLFSAVAAQAGITVTDSMRLGKGEQTYAVIIDCPQPGSAGATDKRFGGSTDSTLDGERCGKCLLDANYGVLIRHPYDLLIKGALVDEKGEPLKNRLVHLFLPNSWTVKTRTTEGGFFRILMGATAERLSSDLLEMDLGQRRTKADGTGEFYALYMLPEDFKSCKASAGASK